jgi:uracil-DNA glycosylase family 4
MDQRRLAYLNAMGIDVWLDRTSVPESVASPVVEQTVATTPVEAFDLSSCTQCVLSETRQHVLIGQGKASPRLMIVGDVPSEEEDSSAQMYRGAAGELLEKMLLAMKLSSDEVFYTPAVKCRPPENRQPHVAESKTCFKHLQQQISERKPECILAFGNLATLGVLNQKLKVTEARGQWFNTADHIPVMVTYHPAYLLRKPEEKKAAWSDLQQVMAKLGLG